MYCVSRGGCYLVNSCCDLEEENEWKKESYHECWLGLVLETRLQYKLTLSETDSLRRESYKQQQVAHFMVERSPSQTLRLGSNCRTTTEPHLSSFDLRRDPCRGKSSSKGSQRQEEGPAVLRKGKEGACVAKEELNEITHNLTKPVRMNFRPSSLMSSPRETSCQVQRRE